MEYTYYIYHIPGVKIGCTTELENRMRSQGFTVWEILWQQDGDYDFGWVAGNKEIELQKEYGLPIDIVNYQVSRMNRPKGRNIGYIHSKETRQKMSAAAQNMSAEHRQKLSAALNGENNPMYGKKHTEETRQKLSAALKGEKHLIVVCPRCNKEGGKNAMIRWHFDNCKHKKSH